MSEYLVPGETTSPRCIDTMASRRSTASYGDGELQPLPTLADVLRVVKGRSGKKYAMDDYQIRQPTNVADVRVRCTTLPVG